MFTCNVCGCHAWHEGLTEEFFYIDNHPVLVEKIPARICDRCGDPNFHPGTVEHVRSLIQAHNHPTRKVEMDVYEFVS